MAFYGSGEDGRVPNDRYALLLLPLAVVFTLLVLVFFVLFGRATVSGDSMTPTLLAEDRLLLTKGYPVPRRGDIIVFVRDEQGRPTEVVKRVIAIPGDEVRTYGDLAWIGGKPEPKGYDIVISGSRRRVGPVTVPKGSVFVLGDNRAVSLDSRFIGFVPLSSVKGRAVAVFSPVTRIRRIAP